MTTYLTSSPTFVYCFTKRLATSADKYTISLKVFRDSVKFLSRYYSYKVYTDLETIEDIKGFAESITVINTDNFIFLDDFKVFVLGIVEDNEIIIDPDVLIYNKLTANYNSDIIFCHRDLPSQPWYQENIENINGSLLYSRIEKDGEIPFIPNLGFLKINNSKLLTDYITQYSLYRNDLLSRFTGNLYGASILLGQYLLGILLYEGNYSYFNHRDNNSKEVYVHLAGPQKFEIYK